ncbi:MAG: hypothetical protein N2689_11070, partial [Verrucomicrobiae bacterium]|nr:hypothetical protein [Verrucomicrobiae bacterium]
MASGPDVHGPVEECLSRGGKVFASAIELLEKQPDFRFFIEYVLFLEAYRAMHPEQAAKLDEHIGAGRVELGAEWSGIYVIQEDEEDLVCNILCAKAYARDLYKLDLETLQLTDLPGFVPQLPQLWFEVGAPEPAVVDKPELALENGKVRLTIVRGTGLARINDVVTGLGLAGRQELPEVCRRPPLGLSVDDPKREKVEPFVPQGSNAVRILADGPVLTVASVHGTVLG